MKQHRYQIKVTWTGNGGAGTQGYRSYRRDHSIIGEGKYQEILASSDPSFQGEASRYNPEDLFVSSLSACHMLWYLHLCSTHQIIVSEYEDHALGVMEESVNGSGRFVSVVLRPQITIQQESNMTKAQALHEEAHKMCFIANSCNFIISHEPEITIAS